MSLVYYFIATVFIFITENLCLIKLFTALRNPLAYQCSITKQVKEDNYIVDGV